MAMLDRRLAGAAAAAALLLAMAAVLGPGCGRPCQDLAALCSQCPNAAYKSACNNIVANNDANVCSADVASFQVFCNLGAGGAGGGAPKGPCLPSQTQCLGQCVNLAANATFCGSCNVQCQKGQLCAAGSCVPGPNCPPALPDKNTQGGCTNKTSDPTCCGATCATCATGQACVAGACAQQGACQGTVCNGACVSLADDPLNCGQCGNACPAGQLCSAGACAASCGAGLTQCCGQCVNTAEDPNNCGGCNPKCPEAMMAQSSSASGGCLSGFQDCASKMLLCSSCGCVTASQCALENKAVCGGACVDLSTDPVNCGKCGALCGPGLSCSSGHCTSGGCAPGQTQCGASCADLQKDPQNCGKCGVACNVAGGQVCDGGACKASCTAPKIDCGGSCTDPTSDPNNCGMCLKLCPQGQKCAAGACAASCPQGQTDCNGGCVDLTTNFDNCGSCGTTCNDNNICTTDSCSAGTCMHQSGALLCGANNPCEESKCDPVKGCQTTPLSPDTIVAGCMANMNVMPPPGWTADDIKNMQSFCLWCDASRPQQPCHYSPRSDGVDCTTDSCDPSRQQGPLHSADDALCAPKPQCARNKCGGSTGGPDGPWMTAPNADGTSGCVQDDSVCNRPCAQKCNISSGNQTPEGCDLNGAHTVVCGQAKQTCANLCSPQNPGIDNEGCVQNDNNCNQNSCAPLCRPDDPNADVNSGCQQNNGLCKATSCAPTCVISDPFANGQGCKQNSGLCTRSCAPICSTASMQADAEGCVQENALCFNAMRPVCCPDKTNTADGCDTAVKCM